MEAIETTANFDENGKQLEIYNLPVIETKK